MKWFFVLFSLLLFSYPGFAQHCLWEVSKGPQRVTIGGTCHCLSPKDYPLPPAFDQAYSQAQVIVFECKLDSLHDPETQKEILTLCQYPDQSTLKDYLSPTVFERLQQTCHDLGIPLAPYIQNHFKPFLPMLTATMIKLKKFGIDPQYGVDVWYYRKAKEDKKKIHTLETASYQMAMVASLADEAPNEFITCSLDELETIGKSIRDIIQAWKTGDVKKLVALTVQKQDATYSKFKDRLLVERNRKWVPQIESLLNANQRAFILVGAAHLVGNENVLSLLKEKGYTIHTVGETK